MSTFFARLEERCRQVDSLLCIGLDPHPADLPEPTAVAARSFCLRLIAATQEVAAAYKPNAAFFEAFGSDGWAALQEVIAAIPPEIPTILDAKRGDIASTADAYARSAFETLGAGALTASPYLGQDSLAPFLQDTGRGVFMLCKTSNRGSGDLQDLPLQSGELVYEKVAQLAQAWNTNGNLGLVVGATHPEALARIRTLAPELWILAPGVGAQGGELNAALQAGLRSDGLGLLLPVSRAIARAADPCQAALDFCQQVRAGVITALAERRAIAAGGLPPHKQRWASLADALLEAGCVKFGQFKLKSGLLSPIYLDLRMLVGFPRLLQSVAQAYTEVLRGLHFQRLAGLPYAALPIATAVSLMGGWPMIYPRKEVKEYGTRAEIEGVWSPGEQAAIIDDLATTGGSKYEAIEKLTGAGLVVRDVVVLIDRQSGASEGLAERGCTLHAVFTLSELLDHWEANGRVPAGQIAEARQFIAATQG